MNEVVTLQSLVPLIDNLSQSLTAIASFLKEAQPSVPAKKETPKKAKASEKAAPASETKPVTIEQVRKVLAEKSQEGLTVKVKELLKKFGADKLSELDPACYADLLSAAQALS